MEREMDDEMASAAEAVDLRDDVEDDVQESASSSSSAQRIKRPRKDPLVVATS